MKPGDYVAQITEVLANSPADSAGLKVDDFILYLTVNGKRYSNAKEFASIIENLKRGDTVKVELFRYAKVNEITIRL